MWDYKAFLFDLNGTMVDDMDYHIGAWKDIFNSLGLPITWEEMKRECYGKNSEVIERLMPGRFSEEEKNKMGWDKEMAYQKNFKPQLKLLPGLDLFLAKTNQQGIRMAIGSAAIRSNIDFVVDNLQLNNYFEILISADDVALSKPDPETWIRCMEALQLQPSECLVFEDSPKGVEAAARAGMQAHVLTTMHPKEDFSHLTNIIAYSADYTSPQACDLLRRS